jgi:hypothetical protein
MPARAVPGDFAENYRPPEAASPTATGCGCSVTGVPSPVEAAQQLHVQGGQAWPATQAGQAQPHPELPEPPPPASMGGAGLVCAQVPVGQGVVTHRIVTDVQPQASAVSAEQEATSVCEVQGSAGGGVPQPHGAQAAPAGQAGQVQMATGAEAVLPGAAVLPATVPDPDAPPAPVAEGGVVVVVVAPLLQAQLQAGQSAPAGQSGQLQVQVPVPLPPLISPPQPLLPPPPPVPPPVVPPPPPEPPVPQLQSQAGQTSPAAQVGQPQVHVPPPPLPAPASTGVGGGQSHWTGGQAPLAGQASGWTHRQVLPDEARSKQKPPPLQS